MRAVILSLDTGAYKAKADVAAAASLKRMLEQVGIEVRAAKAFPEDKEMLKTIFIIMQDFKILEEEKKIGYLSKNETEIIKYRWGYLDRNVHSISDTCLKYNKEVTYLFVLEKYLFEYLGFEIKDNKTNIEKYLSKFDRFFNMKEKD